MTVTASQENEGHAPEPRQLPLEGWHLAHGGTLVVHDGWRVPEHFGDAEAELQAGVEGVAVSDATGRGRLRVAGKDALDFLHRISTNDLAQRTPGVGMHTLFTNAKGRVLDRVFVVPGEGEELLLTSPGEEEDVATWIDTYTIAEDVRAEVVTEATGMCTLLGPQTRKVLAALLGGHVREEVMDGRIAGIPCRVVRESPGMTHLLLESGSMAPVWNALVAAGARPMGWRAQETWRILQAIPRRGREFSGGQTPNDTGMLDDVSFTKGCYIGQEVVARVDTYHQRKFVRRVVEFTGAASAGETVRGEGDEVAGRLTSVAPLAWKGGGLGLAVLDAARTGEQLRTEAGGAVQITSTSYGTFS